MIVAGVNAFRLLAAFDGSPAATTLSRTRDPVCAVRRASRLWTSVACFMLTGWLVVLPALLDDARTSNGADVWDKPAKFWISVALHLGTLALAVRLVGESRARDRAGTVMLGAAYASVAAGLFEVLWISAQAARGRASHFNLSTPLESAMYGVMGVGAVTLVAASFAVGVAVIATTARWNGVRPGVALGLTLGSVLTLVIAGCMSVYGSHYIGVGGTDADGLPLVGWSTTLADLRPAHFVATHLMQALPLVGLCADRLLPSRAGTLVAICALVGTTLALGLFGVALTGHAPLRLLAAANVA